MRYLHLAYVVVAIAACAGCEDDPAVTVVPPDATIEMTCNPLAQTGCSSGEKCTWILDAVMPQYVGHLGCAPDGIATAGESCTFGAPGPSGYDNCGAGLVCGNFAGGAGVCKQVCDPGGGQPTCDDAHVCVTYAGLFSTGETSPPTGGVCDVACDPLADNDFDGLGSALAKTGSTCGAGDDVGCYGYPSYGTPPATGWSCTSDVNVMEQQPTGLRHRVECSTTNGCADPGPRVYVNSCNQGYLPLLYEATGVMKVICVAMCKPMNCYQGNCGTNDENRLGMAPHRCNGVDRVGSFDTAANGEHCQFLWYREVDDDGNFLPSVHSDDVGFCYDHSKYLYDSDADNQPDTPVPACATLPDGFGSGSAFGAADLGCVDSTHAQAAHGKAMKRRVDDGLRPLRTQLRGQR